MDILGKQAILEDAILHLEKDIADAESGIRMNKDTIKQLRVLYKVL
jgi:hypothetical protein